MRNLLAFFRRFRVFLIFAAFQAIALTFYFSQHTYPKNAFLSSTSVVTGSILEMESEVNQYFSLKEENDRLQQQLTSLLNKHQDNFIIPDTSTTLNNDTLLNQRYRLDAVKIIAGNTKMTNNFFTINAGEQEGIEEGMGVIGPHGIVGKVTDVGRKFSIVKTLLSENININGMIAKNGVHGLIKWNSHDPKRVQLHEITNDTDIKIGDTIVTRGSSSSFPRNATIGVVDEIEPNNGAVYLTIHVRLSEDLNSVYHAFVIKDLWKGDIEEAQLKISNRLEQ